MDREPDIPESKNYLYAFLAAVIAAETLINGILLGHNFQGSFEFGIPVALGVSVINVLVFGFAAAYLWRLQNHQDMVKRTWGGALFCLVAIFAVVLNLSIAHFRDRSVPESILEFFVLEGFLSYLLALIGLGCWAFGAWEFYRMDDPYPGYGRLDEKRRRIESDLEYQRRRAMKALTAYWNEHRRRRQADFDDPVEQWKRTDVALREIQRLYKEFVDFIRELDDSCRGTINMYRSANRGKRDQIPAPPHWGQPLSMNWKPPEEPAERILCKRNEAERRRGEALAALKLHLDEIDSCFERCKATVDNLTRLKRA